MHELKNPVEVLPVPSVHPSAVIDPGAEIGAGVTVGPFAVIGPNVKVGARSIIHGHAVIDGYTELGGEVEVFPFAAVGLRPQDLKYDGTPTKLVIGDRTVLREGVTVQPGSTGEGCGLTEVGNDCLIMAYSHVAHDCRIGHSVIVANGTQIAGHCEIEDHVVLGGVTTIHQFVRIGTRAITGASARVQQDVPPFTLADGHPARLYGLNVIGLQRAGFSSETIKGLKAAYRALFLRGTYAQSLEALEGASGGPEVARLCAFLRASARGVVRASLQAKRGDVSSESD